MPTLDQIQERPLLASTKMVRGILAGAKTQTRRLFKMPKGLYWYDKLGGEKEGFVCEDMGNGSFHVEELVCPHGSPGDRLWIRETWRLASINHRSDSQFWTVQFRDNSVLEHPQPDRSLFEPLATKGHLTEGQTAIAFGKWRPSIFLPRWACRITLEITEIQVERLHKISVGDVQAEGVDSIDAYREWWDEINLKSGHGWDTNPWVWVISFKRITPC